MSKASQTELDALHGLVARELARKIKMGEATPAEFSAAIKFLQNNGIQSTVTPGNPLAELDGILKDLPFAGSDGPSH